MKRELPLLLALVACGDDAVTPPSVDMALVDASPERGAPDAELPTPASPSPPEAPNLDCQGPWLFEGGDVPTCRPPGNALRCPPGEARFIDDAACAPIDTCDGPFRPELDDAIFVTPDGRGAGTRADPAAIDEVLEEARSGDVIALGQGRYVGQFVIPDGVRVVGACVDETTLSSPLGAAATLLVPEGARVQLEHLSIRPQDAAGVIVRGSAQLNSVAIEDAVTLGVVVTDTGALDATRFAVKGTQPSAEFEGTGAVFQGGTNTGQDWFMSDNGVAGVLLGDGSLELTGLVSVVNRPVDRVPNGSAVLATGGELRIEGADFRGSTRVAMRLNEVDAQLTRIFVSDSASVDGPPAELIELREGARLALSRSVISGTGALFFATGAANVTLVDTVLIAPEGAPLNTQIGVGLVNTPATIERTVITGGDEGLLAFGPLDFTVPLPGEEPPEPEPLDPIPLVVRDLSVLNVGRRATSESIGIASPVAADIERVLVRGAYNVAVNSSSQDFRLSDLRVEDTRPGDGGAASALNLSGDRSDVRRVFAEGTADQGIFVSNGEALLQDIELRNAGAIVCAEGDDRCGERRASFGFGVVNASANVQRLSLRGADVCGLLLFGEAMLAIDDSLIAEAEIGACIQSTVFDVRDLTRSTRFVDNRTNVETTNLTVPDTPPPPGL
ncbi:MAG: hypothetical protein AAF938_02795 [Myxococcota bacterium]